MNLGSCAAGATCPFSGTLTIDVTTGSFESAMFSVPGLSTFDTITGSSPFGGDLWSILVSNLHGNDTLRLLFPINTHTGIAGGFWWWHY